MGPFTQRADGPEEKTVIRRLLCAGIMSFALAAPVMAAENDTKTELQNLYATMNVLNQQQQAVFQQFQILQEMRRNNDRALYSGQLMAPSPDMQVQNYQDMVNRQQDIMRRSQELERQADQLYSQYTDIGAKKLQLQQRILDLTVPQ
jgi:hypothetical protein